MENINILVEAKKEYTNQLQKILRPRIYEGFKSIYEDIINLSSKELEENKIQTSSIVKTFQKTLKEIPQWNNDMIKNEHNRIETLSNCDYLENLIEAVFITNTKILTSVQINKKSQNIKINIPQSPYFIHKCYMKCAIELYKNPYIFDQSKILTPKEKHNNLREALQLIDLSINNAISDLLPIRDILKTGLTKNNNSEEPEQKEENTTTYLSEETQVEDVISIPDKKINITEQSNQIEKKNISEINNIEEDSDEELEDEELEDEIVLEDKNEILEDDNEVKLEEKSKEDFFVPIKKNIKEIITPIHTPEPHNLKVIDLNKENTKDTEEETKVFEGKELKKIVYNKISPPFASKIKKGGVIKIDLNENANENVNEHIKEDFTDKKEILVDKNNNNNFIKKIKNSKFIKNRFNTTFEKNNSFYKKKYEENSANYNSISDNLKDNILTTIDELKNTQNSFKIIKNKIMLNEASSDEEDNIPLDL